MSEEGSLKNQFANLIRIVAVGAVIFSVGPFAHARNYSNHEGYTDDVQSERTETITDLIIIEAPAPLGPPLQDEIFDEQLTKDFRERYEQKFGRTEAERVYNSPNRYTYYNDLYTFKGSPQEEDAEKHAYANYMIKKLLEHHVEKFAKSDPKVRPVWEAKQKFSQMQVKSKSFKLNARYDIVVGKCDIEIVNPWVNANYTLDMSGTHVKESLLVLSKPVTDTITVESRYRQVEGILAFIGSKKISSALATNLTFSTFTNDSPKSTRETLYLAGASYVF